jgi:hypothetical protein
MPVAFRFRDRYFPWPEFEALLCDQTSIPKIHSRSYLCLLTIGWHAGCIWSGILMKKPTLYNMIAQSEDRSRTAVETLIYVLLILSAVVSIGAAALQPVAVSSGFTASDAVNEYAG